MNEFSFLLVFLPGQEYNFFLKTKFEVCNLLPINSSVPTHPVLQSVLQLLPGLSQMLRPNQEVILHDLRHPDSSVIGICGSVTGRTIGSPITNYVLHTLRTYGNNAPDRINYKTETREGGVLRSSTIFLRDDAGEIIGCLCFNSNVTPVLNVIGQLQSLISFNTVVSPDLEGGDVEEHFATDVSDMMKDVVKKILAKSSIEPTDMHKADKLHVVSELEESGVFNIKGAVEYVANSLHVSVPTIYNYLKEIRDS